MEQYDNNMNNKTTPDLSHQLALLSVMTGVFSMLICPRFYVQFGIGAFGLLLALYSRKDNTFSSLAMIGMIICILSIVISILVFFSYCWLLDAAKDPQYAALIDESGAYEQMRQILGLN